MKLKKYSIQGVGKVIFPAFFSDEIVQNLAMIGFFKKYGIIVVI
ncbi:hypothetical protein RLM30_04480 [Streptococcus pneumoniae]|nr:hypothetical protein [Streptococcus pneumoniae]MDS8963084.1 hypothetical protein [Streptococcus pneumoniae]MDS9232934.1 hypothetical protein [Streptococcus pneumoniae]MDT5978704.1 hypothetical protein [Streptococcus pneumoniae]